MENLKNVFILWEYITDHLKEKGFGDDSIIKKYAQKFFDDSRIKKCEYCAFYTIDIIKELKKDYPEIGIIIDSSFKSFKTFIDWNYSEHNDIEIGEIKIKHYIVSRNFSDNLELYEKRIMQSEDIEKEADKIENEIVAQLVIEKISNSITELKDFCKENDINISLSSITEAIINNKE